MIVTMRRWLILGALLAGVVSGGCRLDPRAVASTPEALATTLALRGPIDCLDSTAREPMVAEHRDGTLFVTGYAAPTPHLWRSNDGGTSWSAVHVGSEADGAIGNSDVDLAIAPDGTLYFVAMTYDRATSEGSQIAVGVSKDAGDSWSWTTLSRVRRVDRPWVEVTPDGTAHVIWNDGNGVSYAVSRDGGRTWTERPRIHVQGGSSHLAVGTNGEIAVRITPVSASGNVHHPGTDLIAVSTDGGKHWVKHTAPGHREWLYPFVDDDPLPRWVEPLAWDANGALYSLWSDSTSVWLARSVDRGAQWVSWRIIEGGDIRYFPYLTARGGGELAATWFSGRDDTLRAHVARVDVSAGDASPRVVEAEPFVPETWQWGETPGLPRHRDTAGEYFPVAFLHDGRLAVVTTIQDDQGKRRGFAWRTADAR